MSTERQRSSPDDSPILINGWRLFAHPLLLDQLDQLTQDVTRIKSATPKTFQHHKQSKLLSAILKIALEVIPADPASSIFRQGNTLGPTYRHRCRAKFFEGRFRLFFRYSTKAKVIVLAWVNDQDSLCTYDSKTDAYAVFQKMLGRNKPPDSWDDLIK